MKAGIVGLPNVGKSTLFNCLTNGKAQSANFPFCTIDPNFGAVTIPDERLNKLVKLIKPEKTIPNSVEIVDIAGLVKGASKGEGLGNQFLSNIRETNAIIHVLRCYENDNITHVEGSVNPYRDKEIIDFELQIKDLETIKKRTDRIERQAKSGDKSFLKEFNVLGTVTESLNKGISVRLQTISLEDNKNYIQPLSLLTSKPVLYVCNINESEISNQSPELIKLIEYLEKEEARVIVLAAKIEEEINELENFEDRKLFLDDLGLTDSGSTILIRETHKLLNLSTFYTAGPKEVKAWTFVNGSKAPAVAGIIHSDFEKGFIRAEVVKYQDFIDYGSESKIRELGKLKIEGKDYVVEDGDIIHFRFNV